MATISHHHLSEPILSEKKMIWVKNKLPGKYHLKSIPPPITVSDLDLRTSKSLRCISENPIFQQFTDFLLDSWAEGIEWLKKIK